MMRNIEKLKGVKANCFLKYINYMERFSVTILCTVENLRIDEQYCDLLIFDSHSSRALRTLRLRFGMRRETNIFTTIRFFMIKIVFTCISVPQRVKF